MLWCLLCVSVFEGEDGRDFFEVIGKGVESGVLELRGVNQSVQMRKGVEELNLTGEVVISNVTLVGGKGVVVRVNSGRIVLRHVTVIRGLDFVMEFVNSSVTFVDCVFVNMAVKSCGLFRMTRSNATFVNTTLDSVSQLPGASVAIVDVVESSVAWEGCKIASLYQNQAFTRLNESVMSVVNCEFSRNTGKVLIRAGEKSRVELENCSFAANSCPVLVLNNSSGSVVNVSVHANCIKDPLIALLESVLEISSSGFFEVSCGKFILLNESSVSISGATVAQGIFPESAITLWKSQIEIRNSSFTNITAVNGSVVLADASTISFSDTKFESINSRSSGAILMANSSAFRTTNVTIQSCCAKNQGSMLSLNNCSAEFVIDKCSFVNNSAPQISSVIVSHCVGQIDNSLFTGTMQREISVPLFNHCNNCTFAVDAETPNVEIIYTPESSPPYIKFLLAGVLLALILLISRVRLRRLFRIRSYFNRHV